MQETMILSSITKLLQHSELQYSDSIQSMRNQSTRKTIKEPKI